MRWEAAMAGKLASFWFLSLSLSLPLCYGASRQDHTGEPGMGQRGKGKGRVYLHLPAKWLGGRKLLW